MSHIHSTRHPECGRDLWRASRSAALVATIVLTLVGRVGAEEPVYVTAFSKEAGRALDAQRVLELQNDLDEYARSAKLRVLRAGDPEEVRLWVSWANFDPRTIGYATVGYVVSSKGALVCQIKYPRAKRSPFTGSCRAAKRSATAAPWRGLLDKLASYSGSELECGVVDGFWVEIDATSGSRRVSVYSSNPDYCRDDGSRVVSELLAAIR